MSEKEIEREILEKLNAIGIVAWKVKTVGTYDPYKKVFRAPSKYYQKGQPDITAVMPGGHALFVEVKSPTGKLAEHQKLFLAKLKEQGAKVLVARSVEDVIEFLASEQKESA